VEPEVIWQPTNERIAKAQITRYTAFLAQHRQLHFADYDALWQWSVADLEGFWQSIWDFFEVRHESAPSAVLLERKMPGARWFPGATVNYVEEVFRHANAGQPAIIAQSEGASASEMSWQELERQVGALSASLIELGVCKGDRVVAFLPNIPQTVVAFLAVASVGAIWSVCSPDMGPVAVLDRFRQIEPKVLFACDGYRYGGRAHDRREVVSTLLSELSSIKAMILVPSLDAKADGSEFRNTRTFADMIANDARRKTRWFDFDHPLWVVYSSGTTGTPKAIVHGHGGVILEGLKGTVLHNDLGPSDRFFWYSSTGWIMWNSQVGGLCAGATICLYDGNPGYPDFTTLWRFVADNKVTFFGAGAAFWASCLKAEIKPRAAGELGALRALGSTGSPLSSDCYRWIYRELGERIWLTAIAGGTDFAGAFLAGNATLPIVVGEMQCRSLGAAVYAFDEAGNALDDEVGELVCTEPIPSMPLYFWNDAGGVRYHESYFDMYPGVWRHGDWLRITQHKGGIIYGRSDATINRHGIRMGTSELYRAVEALPEILDSLVVDLEMLDRPSMMPLFVVLRPGLELDAALIARIKQVIRDALSARHVPEPILRIDEVPRTLSGKKLELPVKKLLLGASLDKVANRDAMANPASLDFFIEFARTLEPKPT